MEDELTYNSEGWVQSQPESTTGNFNKWECKLFEKKKDEFFPCTQGKRIENTTLNDSPYLTWQFTWLGSSPIMEGYHQKAQSSMKEANTNLASFQI